MDESNSKTDELNEEDVKTESWALNNTEKDLNEDLDARDESESDNLTLSHYKVTIFSRGPSNPPETRNPKETETGIDIDLLKGKIQQASKRRTRSSRKMGINSDEDKDIRTPEEIY